MGEFMTTKQIANKVKSRGLQKLRFFCQMCQKQCRDDNGFKCHCQTEGHLRQMALFAQNPDKFMDSFSKEFEKTFIELLSRRFGTRRVHANIVYNEYIQDKEHAHMNSTMWTSLSEFVKYLGRTGKCIIEEDPEKGWFLTWINRDPEAVRRQQDAAKRKDRELDDDARYEAEIEAIADAARRAAAAGALPPPTEGGSDDSCDEGGGTGAMAGNALDVERLRAGGAPSVKIALVSGMQAGNKRARVGWAAPEEDDGDGGEGTDTRPAKIGGLNMASRPALTNMQRLMAESESEKIALLPRVTHTHTAPIPLLTDSSRVGTGKVGTQALPAAANEDWLLPGITVRVMNRRVGEGVFYKQKGCITKVVDTYGALVKMAERGETLQLDVSDLETTCPAVGGGVVLLAGPQRGQRGVVTAIYTDTFCADIQVQATGVVLKGVDYEGFSRES